MIGSLLKLDVSCREVGDWGVRKHEVKHQTCSSILDYLQRFGGKRRGFDEERVAVVCWQMTSTTWVTSLVRRGMGTVYVA